MNGAADPADTAGPVSGEALPQHSARVATSPAQELTAEEIQALRDVASERTHGYRFPQRLEREFKQHERRASRVTRVCLALLAVLGFGTAPLWQAALTGTPPDMVSMLLGIEVSVVALFALIAWMQLRHVDSDFGEFLMMGGFLLIVAAVEMIRYRGYPGGYLVAGYLTAPIPVAVATLARLSMARCIGFIFGYIAVITGAWLWMPGEAPPRDPQEGILQALLLGTALLTAAGTRLSSRRQWAAVRLLAMMAFRDPLTGLGNRRALEDRYEIASRAVSRGQQRGLFFALLDMDHFKMINDVYGHEYGDGVLAELGVLLAQFARRSLDMAARLGGDEFALLLYDCDVEHGRERLAELLQAIRDLQIEHSANSEAVVTGTAGGVAVAAGQPLSEAYHAADRCLYRAKHAGRNGLVVENLNRPVDAAARTMV
ncbi:MAG TPA: GGDEF domain-containing protein [Solimonas sp.]|nr:GGDEF domain-containing protein [Solimonas sp.]